LSPLPAAVGARGDDMHGPHPVLPEATHDEFSREEFLRSMRRFVITDYFPCNRTVYDGIAKPAFEQRHGHAPRTRQEVAEAFGDATFFRTWCAVHRATQELLWDVAGETAARQLPTLIETAKRIAADPAGCGSLTLDPAIAMPRYLESVDIHVMPGNFQTELAADDVYVGAMYDRGVHVFAMGQLGPYTDALGKLTVDFLKSEFADLKPKRILDLGCTLGHSTFAFADAFPDAEVHGVDLGAPMLRYGHARARALGRPIHFRQADVRNTGYPDGHFDLIVSHLLLHEMPVQAIKDTIVESYRLLAPGGLTVHNDGAGVPADPYDDFVTYEWALANNEPFSRGSLTFDWHAECAKAGFRPDDVFAGGRQPAYLREQIRLVGLRGARKAG
jgi:SAM-dependent methyltransferase